MQEQHAPSMIPAEVAAAMQSEYSTKYNTKSDAINLNGAMLQCASVLADKTLPVERRSKLILSKVQNFINKAIVYPLTMSASYVLGHGDSWCPFRTRGHDSLLFQRAVKPHASPYDIDDAGCTIAPGNNNAPQDVDANSDSTNDDHNDGADNRRTTRVQGINALVMYSCRNEALSDWSPYEVCMAFDCGPANTSDSRLLQVNDQFPASRDYGHKPFFDRSGKPAVRIPQLFRDPPPYPDMEATHDVKDDYAAWALGNFFPFDRLFSELVGSTLWDKLQHWRMTMFRGKKDKFAMRCLDHFQQQSEARSQMRVHNKQLKVQRRLVVAANGNGDASSDDTSVSI